MRSTVLRCASLITYTLGAALPLQAPAQTSAQTMDDVEETGEAPDIPLTPEALGDVLSCRSPAGGTAFASALFLDRKAPSWMRETKGGKETRRMLGLYGYKLSRPVSMLGEPVDRVYFMKDWVVVLWPREKANAFIVAHQLERAPIKVAEQYYRFIDPESGPMLGVFEPTGNTTAMLLAKASGAEVPPSPPAASLFVGCNYTPASRADFLDAARQSEAMVSKAFEDIDSASEDHDPQ